MGVNQTIRQKTKPCRFPEREIRFFVGLAPGERLMQKKKSKGQDRKGKDMKEKKKERKGK